jgi:sorbitol-specific phosphotransferase system component IIA
MINTIIIFGEIMAKIIEEIVVIKFSKLVKSETQETIVSAEIQAALEQVAQELVGDSIIVEVESA